MHIYWRVQQDLETFGQELVLNHPNLARAFIKWVIKNRSGLAMSLDLYPIISSQLCYSKN